MIRNFSAKAAVLGAVLVAFSGVQQARADFWDELARAFNPGPSGRHTTSIIAPYAPGTILVSFGDRRLYFITGKGKAISYPIAIPKPEARWAGVSFVSQKQVNPGWTPTPQMRRENPKLPASVPGGHPRNPMGVRALYLGSTLYRIHGTDAPWLIGESVSKGCVRMYNNDVIDLYDRARVGAKVVITWQKFRTSSSI
ncbi:MAG: L,D-transpeptidase [Hyphomicrobiales bacterium]|nr:L,D-transpeptidase [Hyphomicrobiales bacterium]